MPFPRAVKFFLFAASFLALFSTSAQVDVYEDSAHWSGQVFISTNEFGDEIVLAGTARVITKIAFECKGDFAPPVVGHARLRLYANNGPAWRGNTDYFTPGLVPLWESPDFTIDPGFNTKEIPVPSIKVPKRFTWTVKFTERAGLLLYGTATNGPSIGGGFNDFWERFTTGWEPRRSDGAPRNDFGAYILAIPEAIVPKLTASFYAGTRFILLSWPVTDTQYILQGKIGATNQWVDVSAPPNRIGDTWQRVLEFGKVGIFRLRQVAPRAPGSLQITRETNSVHLRWPAAATGYILQVRSLLSSLGWTDLRSPAESTNGFFEVTRTATSITEIFRLRESAFAATLEITLFPSAIRIRWPESAPNYTLQSKAAASLTWTNETTPTNAMDGYFQFSAPASASNKLFRLVQ